MKKKADFVTNSSSTSFIVLGWQINHAAKDEVEPILKDFESFEDNVKGVQLDYGHSDDFGVVAEASIEEINEYIEREDFKKAAKELGAEPKIFYIVDHC